MAGPWSLRGTLPAVAIERFLCLSVTARDLGVLSGDYGSSIGPSFPVSVALFPFGKIDLRRVRGNSAMVCAADEDVAGDSLIRNQAEDEGVSAIFNMKRNIHGLPCAAVDVQLSVPLPGRQFGSSDVDAAGKKSP